MKNYLLMAIVQKGEGDRVMKAMRASGAKGGTICFARGTASSSILSVLGLGESLKEVIISLLSDEDIDAVLSSCIATKSKKGVAFIMDANSSEDDAMNNEWQLIEIIVEKGYSEDVMAHARKAGASGGTIVNAHGTASEEDAKFFVLLNLGLIATAMGIALFKTPNHFAFGGTSGLSIILSTLFPQWNVGFFMWIVNAILVLLGFAFLGVKSMGWTIYSSFALSFFVSLCERIWPLTAPLTHDVFLELCYAVILPAVGSAIVFNIGASTGGTDIVAMILHKYTSLEIGRALLISDLAIVLVGAYLYGPTTGLYCILGMVLKTTVVDSAIESINLRKVCTVVTTNPGPVRDFIVKELNRSATEERAEGAYTHEEKWVLMTVLTRGQAQHLRRFVRRNDPHAFITIVNSSEIVGKGFRSI